MTVMTYIDNASAQDGSAGVQVAAGYAQFGGHVDMTLAEQEAFKLAGHTIVIGPSKSPGAPAAAPAVVAGAAGLPVGTYRYCVTFVTDTGETLAGPEISGVVLTSQHGTMSAIPLGPAGSGVTKRKVYRTLAGGVTGSEKLLTTINDNTTTSFDDNIADGSLGANLPSADGSSNAAAVATALAAFAWVKPSSGDIAVNA